jgi:predicted DNA-binding transcriptional regulator AlpA
VLWWAILGQTDPTLVTTMTLKDNDILSHTFLTREEWADARRVSVRTVRRDELHRRGPNPVRIGRKVYYRKAEIERWLNSLGGIQ